MRRVEFCERTGATNRQVDYWTKQGIPLADRRECKGSGHYRQYDESTIDRVKLLVRISNSPAANFTIETLKEIFHCYELGGYEIGEGITIEWEVVNGTNAAPESSAGKSR